MQKKLHFSSLVVITLLFTYFLIFFGGFVRMTGSGMGCPDWPKCFDKWIPPNDATDLPPNYKALFLEKRQLKNKKIAFFFEKIGAHTFSKNILDNPKIYHTDTFNIKKAWIEYLNRVIGVILGFIVTLLTLGSFQFYKKNNKIILFACLTFFFLLLEAFIGSILVSTNLLNHFLNLHVLFAIPIILFLICILFFLQKKKREKVKYAIPRWVWIGTWVNFGLIVLQIVLGLFIREAVEHISDTTPDALSKIGLDQIGEIFYIHRSFSILILITTFLSVVAILHYSKKKYLKKTYYPLQILMSSIVIEILLGASIYYFDFPPFLQPLHLLLANLIVGSSFYLVLDTYSLRKKGGKGSF